MWSKCSSDFKTFPSTWRNQQNFMIHIGTALGFSYAQTRNLLTPITIHATWNSGVILLLTFLQVNYLLLKRTKFMMCIIQELILCLQLMTFLLLYTFIIMIYAFVVLLSDSLFTCIALTMPISRHMIWCLLTHHRNFIHFFFFAMGMVDLMTSFRRFHNY